MKSAQESKVYYPETIEEEPLPGIPYSGITGVPQSLSEINSNEGMKLGGIEIVNGNPQWINDIVNERINTAEKQILRDFNFGDTDFAGGVYAGNIAWNTGTGAYVSGNGILINRKGIIGANGSVVTFSIDATTGNATFRGDVTASTITGGTISGTTMSASTITGTTITGGTVRTSSGGTRIEMDGANNFFQSYVSGTLRMRLASGALAFYNTSGTNIGDISAGSSAVQIAGSGATLLIGNNQVSPFANGTQLGTSSFRWGDIYSQGHLTIQDIFGNNAFMERLTAYQGITLGGVYRTTWPAAGTTTLSGLSIDADKSWSNRRITSIDRITLSGVGSYFNCNSGYIDNARAIYFELGRTTNPNISGQMNYFDGSTKGFRGHVNGFTGQFQLNSL